METPNDESAADFLAREGFNGMSIPEIKATLASWKEADLPNENLAGYQGLSSLVQKIADMETMLLGIESFKQTGQQPNRRYLNSIYADLNSSVPQGGGLRKRLKEINENAFK